MPKTEDRMGKKISPKELTKLLIREFGFAEGDFELALDVQVHAGPLGSEDRNVFPGIAFRITAVGVEQVPKPNMLSVSASEAKAKPVRKIAKKSTPKSSDESV